MRRSATMLVAMVGVFALIAVGCSAPSPTSPAQAPSPPQKAAAAPAAAPAPAAPAAAPAPAKQEPKPAAAPAPAKQEPKPAAAPAPPKTQRLVWACCPLTSAFYPYAVAAAKVINENAPGAQITVSESRGAVDGLKLLQNRQVHIISSQALFGAEAYRGLAQFKDAPVTDLRGLWMYDMGVVAYVVREDSGITSVAGLHGRDFAGGTGTYTDVLARNTLGAAGIEPKWFRGSLADALAAFRDRRISGFAKAVGASSADANILEMQTAGKVRILGWTPDLIDKVKKQFDYYIEGDIPANVYKDAGNDRPIRTWAAPQTTLVLKDLDAELAYSIVRAVDRIKEPQVAALKSVGDFDFAKLGAEMSPLPVHAGTLKYLRERGLPLRPAIVPPEGR
ncbi:MAG: TAXI family TRAP transporter solute-binding subunit [Chloroflexi bacterium]|nr:TAXI family TRAP transporter solute-binding subunit [Chloroflexota bacterium]